MKNIRDTWLKSVWSSLVTKLMYDFWIWVVQSRSIFLNQSFIIMRVLKAVFFMWVMLMDQPSKVYISVSFIIITITIICRRFWAQFVPVPQCPCAWFGPHIQSTIQHLTLLNRSWSASELACRFNLVSFSALVSPTSLYPKNESGNCVI